MKLDLKTIQQAIGAEGAPPALEGTGWSVDSRTQIPGDVYFALRGPNHDGHEYVKAVLANGAAGAVVEQSGGSPGELTVSDSRAALKRLAGWARGHWGGRVAAVTGSAGKTTTKDAIAHLAGVDFTVGRTAGNLNNDVGVPLSILRLPDEARVAVLEIGMNHAGEIRELARIAKPGIGVVTNVGYAHLEFFDSIDGIAAAKRELIEELPADGVAVLNADDERVRFFAGRHGGRTVTFGFSEHAEVRAENMRAHGRGTRFEALGVEFETSLTGRHSVMNLLAGIAVAREWGIAPERLTEAVRTFTTGKMRGERLEHNGIVIWNDCYNSNPEAARSMLDVLAETPAARRIAVLGEMLELGRGSEQLHGEVGRYAAARGVDLVVGVKGAARKLAEEALAAGAETEYFEEAAAAGAFVKRVARAGDAVLFKGSRGVHMEKALERFVE
jgi:UDP-N-acetylmuramoyl-tripeptide--D-alanyl-D-alanine ligase